MDGICILKVPHYSTIVIISKSDGIHCASISQTRFLYYFHLQPSISDRPEIQNSLLPGQQANDRPDIVARVFKQKLNQFIQELKTGTVLGKTAAFMYVIEFQKRGLPHCHILFITETHNRLHTSEDVDNVISAELPQNPNSYP